MIIVDISVLILYLFRLLIVNYSLILSQDSEDSDSDFGSDSDESSSDEEDGDAAEGKPKLVGRAKWLKKTVVTAKKYPDDEGPKEASKEDRAKRDAEEEEGRKVNRN